MNKKIALIGNPNCGKTTLFNALTGTYQKVGNWSGVTTEKKEGFYKKDKSIQIVDLPGLYSLSARSKDEMAVIDYLNNERPDVIINVVDGTNLKRNLFLTTLLLELKIPLVMAVNHYDRLLKENVELDVELMSGVFKSPVIPVSALKGINLDKLVSEAVNRRTVAYFDLKALYKGEVGVSERYDFIEKSIPRFFKGQLKKGEQITQRIDNVLLHKKWGIPIFVMVMLLVYFVSIRLGGVLGGLVQTVFDELEFSLGRAMTTRKIPQWITSLSCEAVIGGIGTVASFLPQILILFTLLAVMEQSGYSARTSFLLDRIFRTFGLGGKSFIPMMLGCGCTVSGLMSTRTIEDRNEKIMTIYLTPFIPCGAKTAVFGWFSSLLFGGSAVVATSMYFLGIFSVCFFGRLLKRFKFFSESRGTFVLEIPELKPPHFKDVFLVLKEKVKDFVTKAGLIVFVFSVILWALRNLGFSGYTNGEVEKSFLFLIGNLLKYLFYPLGFSSWQTSVAVVSGIFAKEAVIETLNLLSNSPKDLFRSGFTAFSFTSFILLSPPCIASIMTAHRELKSKKLTFYMLVFQTAVAYVVSFFINTVGIIVNHLNRLILPLFIVIIIIVAFSFSIKRLKTCDKNCSNCKSGEKCQKTEKRFTT